MDKFTENVILHLNVFVKFSIFTRKVSATKFLMDGQTGVSFQIQVSVKVSELAHLKIKKTLIIEVTCTAQKSFPLRFSSVNMTKSAGNCGFGHIN